MITQKNYRQDILAFNKFTKLLLKSNFSGKFLYTSSGVVYEHTKIKNLFSYKYNYAKAKITNEKIIRTVLSKKIKCSVARCFVGKYLSLNSKYVIGNIINIILNQKKIIIKNR